MMHTRLLTLIALAVTLVLCGCSPQRCIVVGQAVSTSGGSRAIETIKPGDKVLQLVGTDVRAAQVEAAIAAIASSYRHIAIADGRTLDVTGIHPVLTDHGWVKARRVRVGDQIVTDAGLVPVVSNELVRKQVHVVDLSVGGADTFLVNGIVVHNKTIRLPPKREELVGLWVSEGPVHHTRMGLRLDEDGGGILSFVAGSSKPGGLADEVVSTPIKWALDRSSMVIEVLDEAALGWHDVVRQRVHLRAYSTGLSIIDGLQGASPSHSVGLRRVSFLRHQFGVLENTANARSEPAYEGKP